MKKLIKKPAFIIALLVVVFLLAWFFYSRRKRPYLDYGRSDWAGDTDFEGKLAFKTVKQPNVKVGDKILVEQEPGAKYTQIDGEHTVLEVLLPPRSWDKKHFWIVVDSPHPGNGPADPGKYRKA